MSDVEAMAWLDDLDAVVPTERSLTGPVLLVVAAVLAVVALPWTAWREARAGQGEPRTSRVAGMRSTRLSPPPALPAPPAQSAEPPVRSSLGAVEVASRVGFAVNLGAGAAVVLALALAAARRPPGGIARGRLAAGALGIDAEAHVWLSGGARRH